jgi:hypothetical protein
MRTTAAVVRLHPPKPIILDDGPEAVAFVASEIRLSNLTYKQISERSGVCVQTVSNIACADTKLPRWMTVVKIARALGWSLQAHRN